MEPIISSSDVEHIAHLARLDITREETENFRRQLGGILQYVARLEELDTGGIEPTMHAVPLTNVFRQDEPAAGLAPEDALSNAPGREGDFFKMPKILDTAEE